jgi:hypothetical protein
LPAGGFRLGAFLACAAALLAASASGGATRRYERDESEFPNPERGFSKASGSPADARAANLSLSHLYVRLDAYKGGALPDRVLTELDASFGRARAAGVKLIPRFIYSFPAGLPLAPGDTDAPLPRVLQHIGQLRPVLRANADVIAFLEAGFIGAWGEWHHSTNGLDAPAAKKAILAALLESLPANRAVALRYSRDKIEFLGRSEPLTAAEAFRGRAVARIGHHNDCFLAARDDWDTYREEGSRSIETQKAYLASENRFLPQGGETCNDKADAQPYIQCANALRELARLRWSQLNADYHPGVLALWRGQGCYGEIARRLGYRFRLTDAEFPASVRLGSRIRARMTIVNDGFASLYNPRGLELVFRNAQTGREHVIPLKDDPRRWDPQTTHKVIIDSRLPRSLRSGSYAAYLSLPDPAPRLRGRPAYSIRLANKGLWEPRTGYNALGFLITVRR